MSIFLDRFKTRLYYPPVDKPRLAGGKLDVAQVAGNAVEKIVKLIPVSYTHLDVYKRQVGGPATADNKWIPDFLAYCRNCLLYTSRCV